QRDAVEVRSSGYARELGAQRVDLRLDRGARGGVVRVVTGLHREVAHALQDGVDLGQGAFCGLDDRDAVLGVACRDVQPVDLRAQTLADGQARRVVRGPVDAQTARELLERLRQVV